MPLEKAPLGQPWPGGRRISIDTLSKGSDALSHSLTHKPAPIPPTPFCPFSPEAPGRSGRRLKRWDGGATMQGSLVGLLLTFSLRGGGGGSFLKGWEGRNPDPHPSSPCLNIKATSSLFVFQRPPTPRSADWQPGCAYKRPTQPKVPGKGSLRQTPGMKARGLECWRTNGGRGAPMEPREDARVGPAAMESPRRSPQPHPPLAAEVLVSAPLEGQRCPRSLRPLGQGSCPSLPPGVWGGGSCMGGCSQREPKRGFIRARPAGIGKSRVLEGTMAIGTAALGLLALLLGCSGTSAEAQNSGRFARPKCVLSGNWTNDLASTVLFGSVSNTGVFSGVYQTAVSSSANPIRPSPLRGIQRKGDKPTFGFTVNWSFSGLAPTLSTAPSERVKRARFPWFLPGDGGEPSCLTHQPLFSNKMFS
ncbi:uncharacterized protein LOC116512781 isoform X2 [Thamnophis elegans]|uniref:uncharacterized protein LOC116512781 isoform X2 n=1 Tax=Thamnophis elegans TaxID=35005 RepID=UPI001377FCEA|nr:uncharacterized protein LOC116512781 isoform X2 [Thamnophis elegans]